ncbi:hypothetical protein FPOAC2_12829 [Fusarium poae]|uniref:hypothetical protein n=1 Tax=Fusarium poae TaxID=36050 RepID=UPI001CEBCCB7|nr:hypothetical protein FPOAC1_012485 [Fusarium poae]KAG8667652.1 hypothetical protein FPOAC1_012485 [Fusarium poae]
MAPISLPDCEGPSLKPFPHNLDEFHFIEVLNCDTLHGVIVKAQWNNRLYAVKFFISDARPLINYEEIYSMENYPNQCCEAFDWHFDPFEKECRAFGRLQEVGCEHLAVKVHGYVRVTSDYIKDKLRPEQRSRFQKLTVRNSTPQMMGIVKDWIEMAEYDNEDLRSRYDRLYQIFHIPQMIEDLHGLHRNGIVVRDLRSDQYVNGVLVDLSCSATVPHPYGPTTSGEPSMWQPRWTFSSLAAWDLFSFQWQIILLWNKEHEHLVKLLGGRPQGMPDFCPFVAYCVPSSSDDYQEVVKQTYGPFLPMLNHFKQPFPVREPPRWDPLEYLDNRHFMGEGEEAKTM